jgi:hypothetical protein
VRAARPVVRAAARRAIAGRNRSRSDPTAGRFTRLEITRIVDVALVRLERHIPGLPRWRRLVPDVVNVGDIAV